MRAFCCIAWRAIIDPRCGHWPGGGSPVRLPTANDRFCDATHHETGRTPWLGLRLLPISSIQTPGAPVCNATTCRWADMIRYLLDTPNSHLQCLSYVSTTLREALSVERCAHGQDLLLNGVLPGSAYTSPPTSCIEHEAFRDLFMGSHRPCCVGTYRPRLSLSASPPSLDGRAWRDWDQSQIGELWC